MHPFATEFPIKEYSRAEFIALVTSWLKGTSYSKLFGKDVSTDLHRNDAVIEAPNGELLKVLELTDDVGTRAIGFRHDNPDRNGRLWRSELVVSRNVGPDTDYVVRARTQCLAKEATAEIEKPKKPYILKTILQDGRAASDAYLDVQDKCHRLPDDKYSLDVAKEIISGNGSEYLPVVYVSCISAGRYELSKRWLDKLSFELGGLAHVVLEPSRAFSAKLRDAVDARNAYGGSIGVYLPNAARGRKFYIGGAISDQATLFQWIVEYCSEARSRLPAKGWDWTELQEQALREQRTKSKNRLSVQETEELYLQEIETLKERIEELESHSLATPEYLSSSAAFNGNWNQEGIQLDFREIYDGESKDRLRYLVQTALEQRQAVGMDGRSQAFANSFLEKNATSSGLIELKRALASITKDEKKYSKEIVKFLATYGLALKSDKKHIRLEPSTELLGVESITIVKTPSDHRSLKNQKSQIESALGVTKLS